MMARDEHGLYVSAKECPANEPYRAATLWAGSHGNWRLTVERVEGDPLPHLVAFHIETGICHAERREASTPAQAKAWTDELPAVVAADASGEA